MTPKSESVLMLPLRSPRPGTGPGGGSVLAAVGRLWAEFTDPGPGGDAPVFIKNHADGIVPGCMGVPFLAVGVTIMVVFARQINLADRKTFVPLLFGAVFGLAGLFVTTLGIKTILRKAGPPVAPEGAPWTSDNNWDITGATPDNPAGGFASAFGRLVFLVFIGLMNILWMVKINGGGRLVVALVVGLFDLIALLILFDIVRKWVQAIRVGTPKLAWRTFPFFTGGRLDAVFQTTRPMRPNGPPKVTLRLIEQRTGVETGSGQVTGVRSFRVWSSEQTLSAFAEGTMTSFPFSVAVPADQPGTDLSKIDCTYWQLVVTVPVAGPDVEAVFLVPIYTRPA